MPDDNTQAFVVLRRKDFYSMPRIIAVSLDEDKARTFAWQEAKNKFRYSGPMRDIYTYFDQEIRIDVFPLF